MSAPQNVSDDQGAAGPAPDIATSLKGVVSAFRMIMEAVDVDPAETKIKVGVSGRSPTFEVVIADLLAKADAAVAQHEAQVAAQTGPSMRDALSAASSALRSYQHGNTAPELARSVADVCDAALACHDDPGGSTNAEAG